MNKTLGNSVWLLWLMPLWAMAHGGEPHDQAKTSGKARTYFASVANSDKYELLLKYAPIERGKETVLRLFVSAFATNEPVDKATLQLVSPEDKTLKFTVKQTDRGTYEIRAVFPENKAYSLTVNINSPLGADLMLIKDIGVGRELPHSDQMPTPSLFSNPVLVFGGGLLLGLAAMFLILKLSRRRISVPGAVLLLSLLSIPVNTQVSKAHGEPEGGTGGGASDVLDVLKETQFLFGITTQRIQTGDFTESTAFFGTVVPASNGQALVQTPFNGKIRSLSVQVGQKVRKGQLMAVIEQNLDAPAQVGLESERNNLEAEYQAAKAEYDRLQTIRDIAAKRDVTEAEARYQRALKNLRVLRNLGNGSAGNARLTYLNAPIDGVVGTFNFALGATVDPGQTLFTLTDLNKVYVEAQVFEKDAAQVKAGTRFTARSPADTTKKQTLRVLASAQAINPTNQSQSVLFEMDNTDGSFKIGEYVNIRVYGGASKRGLYVPNTALNEINGKPVAFVKDGPELYSMVYLNTGNSDGSRTRILKGVEEGERLVLSGTYQLKMMYLNQ